MFKGGLKLFKSKSTKSIKPGLQKDRLAENISRENGRKSIDDSAFKIHLFRRSRPVQFASWYLQTRKNKNVQFRFSAKKCYLIVQSKTLTWSREGYSHGKNVDQKVKNSEQSITLYFSVLQAVCYNFFVCLRWKSKRENIRFSKWTSYRAVAGLVLRQFYENTTTNTWPFEIKRPSNY